MFLRICSFRTVLVESVLGMTIIILMDHITDRVTMPVPVGITRSFTFPF